MGHGIMPGGDLSWLLKVRNTCFRSVLSHCREAFKLYFEICSALGERVTNLRCVNLKVSGMQYWLSDFMVGFLGYSEVMYDCDN